MSRELIEELRSAGYMIHANRIEELEAQVKLLRDAGQALVWRWDSPLWKDQTHTAAYIHQLRDAIAATEPK